MKNLPKVLIVSRGVWDDTGTSSTLSNIFENYDCSKLSHIYIETKKPNTSLCRAFFQISEFSLVKKLYKWNTRTGQKVGPSYQENNDVARKEESAMRFVRGHRSYGYTIIREFLWHMNGWKSKELSSFIHEQNPDVIWLTGSPLILMNRLSQYVVRESNRPYCLYEMDDVYSYKNCGRNPLKYLYRFFLRKRVKPLIKGASQVFVISPKMKREFDSIFGINSLVLTKGIDFSTGPIKSRPPSSPLNMVYTGQLIYGRMSTIGRMAAIMDAINSNEKKMVLSIYTGTYVPYEIKKQIEEKGSVVFHSPVPYSQVAGIIERSDVVLFVESFDPRYKNIARLSFSTKLTDYLAGGKCVFAIGPEDIAPIEYLNDNGAAITVSDEHDFESKLGYLLKPGVIELYANKAYECGKKNHNKSVIDEMLFSRLMEISNNENSTVS